MEAKKERITILKGCAFQLNALSELQLIDSEWMEMAEVPTPQMRESKPSLGQDFIHKNEYETGRQAGPKLSSYCNSLTPRKF